MLLSCGMMFSQNEFEYVYDGIDVYNKSLASTFVVLFTGGITSIAKGFSSYILGYNSALVYDVVTHDENNTHESIAINNIFFISICFSLVKQRCDKLFRFWI